MRWTELPGDPGPALGAGGGAPQPEPPPVAAPAAPYGGGGSAVDVALTAITRLRRLELGLGDW